MPTLTFWCDLSAGLTFVLLGAAFIVFVGVF
jgi:hypothetical protein